MSERRMSQAECAAALNAQLGATTLGEAAEWQAWVKETGGIGCACIGCSVRTCRVCNCQHWWAQNRALLAAASVVARLARDLGEKEADQ